MGRVKPVFTTDEVEIPGTRWMNKACVHRFKKLDGSPGQWESIKGSDEPTVLLCGLTTGGEMILVNLFRFPVNEFCYELPGGTVEKNESLLKAVLREFLQETGYEPKRISELCNGYLWNGKSNQKFEIWLGEDCVKTIDIARDPVEQLADLKVVLMKPSDIKKGIASGDSTFDPPISHAIMAMESKGVI